MSDELENLRDDVTLHFVDFPGFGDAPSVASWSMEQIASEIHDALNAQGIHEAVICGISMGGYLALEFFRQNPSFVRALVLSNTRATADTAEAKEDRRVFAQDAHARGAQAAIDRLYSKFVTDETDLEIAHDIREWMSAAKPDSISAALQAMADRRDSTDLLRLIPVPSLVICGSRDETMPSLQMREMAVKLPSASFVDLDGAAHLTAAERPLEWAEAFSSFLDRL